MRQLWDDSAARTCARVLICASALLLIVCGDPVSPRSDATNLRASFSFAPQYPADAGLALHAAAMDVDNVHIVLRRTDGSVVLDTVVTFPVGVDSIAFEASVRLQGSTEQFSALIQLRNGAVVLFEGTQKIDAHAGLATAQTVAVSTHYAGPGSSAARVTISPRSLPLVAGASVQLAATVADSAGAAISGVPLIWSSADPTVATVSATGNVTALGKRGTTTVTVRLLSGLSDLVSASVTLPPATTRAVAGLGQTGRAGDVLTQPLVVEVDASDGVPVAGVAVNFRALTAGASVSPASGITDASGRASTTMTLGSFAGAQAFEAVAAPLSALPVSATATAAAPAQLAVVSGNAQTDTAGKKLASPFVVSVTDKFGNVVSGAVVAWQRVSGSGSLASASSVTDASGQASMTYTLGAQSGTESVSASIAAGASATFSASSLARPPTTIVATTGSSYRGNVGASVPLGVLVTDALGQPVASVTVFWTASGGAAVATPTSVTASDGRATMTATFATQPGSSTVFASFGGAAKVQFDLVATTGAASQLLIVAGNGQSAPAGSTVSVSPAVRVLDAFANPVSASVTFAITAGGGSVTGTPVQTDATGLATVGSWKLGPAGPQSLTASVGALSTAFTATSTSIGPPQLAIVQQPNTTQQNGQPFSTNPQVQLQDNLGAPLATSGVSVTVGLASGGQTLGGVLTVNTNASGLAVFTGLSILGTVGTNQMVFSAPTFANATSTTITVTPGVPTQMAAVTPLSMAGVVGTAVSPPPKVVLKDVSGNPVPGRTVTFTPGNGASGVVVGGAAVTGAAGDASPTSWTLGPQTGKDTLIATFAGVTGNPVVFEATASSASATQLVIVSGNSQTGVTGQPLALPLVVEARDALNNPTSGVNVTFTVTVGGGSPSTQTIATDAAGRASFTWTLGSVGVQNATACLASCSAQVQFNAQAIPVGANAVWTGSTSGSWSTAANWNPAAVPSSTSKVFIPSGTPNAPTLTSPVTVSDLTMATGTTLNSAAFQLDVTGDLLASGATISGAGIVRMTGGGKQLAGTIPSLTVDAGATITATGTTTIAGNLLAQGGAVFDAGSVTTTIGGTLIYANQSGARLRMNNAAAHLVVGGDAYFNAADMGDADLTAGTLEFRGNFTAQLNYYQSFRAAGTHLTKFNGTSAQSIYFYYPADNQSRFQNVEFANAAGVTFSSAVVAAGDATITGTTALSGGRLNVSGLLTSVSGTSLAALSDAVIYGGTTFPRLAGAAPPMMYLSTGTTIVAPSGATSYPGALTVQAGTTLDIAGNSLTVAGTLTYANQSGARLRMNNPAGRLVVNGDAYFNASDMGDADLTAGVLEFRGNFTAQLNYYQSFRATGTHLTKFNGTSAQSVYFYYPADAQSRVQNAEFANAAGITFSSAVVVAGSATALGTTTLSGARLNMGGQLTSAAGTSLAGLADVVVYGAGTTFPLIAGVAPPMVYLSAGGTITAPTGTTVLPGALTVQGSTTLDIGSNALTINGSLTYANQSNARLRMNSPSAHVIVGGDAYFNASDMGDADLTAGVLEFRGNFTAQLNYYQSFRASGTHLTKFNGTNPQSIYLYYPADAQSRFQNAEFANAAGITFSSAVVVAGSATALGTTTLSGARLNMGGQFTSAAGTSLAGLADLLVYNAGATFPLIAGVGPPVVYLSSGGTINAPSGTTILPTALTVQGSTTLDLGANTLTVTGALTYANQSNARLFMTNPAAHLIVGGDAYFNAADMGDADLTAGVLEFRGNFTAQLNYYQSFRATGAHLTKFNGTAAQSIYFYYPSGSQSQFAHVEFANGSGAGVSLASGVVVAGNAAQNGRLGVPTSLSIAGALSLGATSITNVTGTLTKASCSFAPGAVFTGFTCP